jgi:hypothetical protein
MLPTIFLIFWTLLLPETALAVEDIRLHITRLDSQVVLTWQRIPGARFLIFRSDEPMFTPTEETLFTFTQDTFLLAPVVARKTFYRLVVDYQQYTLSAERTVILMEGRRLAKMRAHLIFEHHPYGCAVAVVDSATEVQRIYADGCLLVLRSDGSLRRRVEWELPIGDRNWNIDDGSWGPVGGNPRFDFPAWAEEEGWLFAEQEGLWVFSAHGDTLLVDPAINQVVARISHFRNRRYLVQYAYVFRHGIPLRIHWEEKVFQEDTLARRELVDFSGVTFNEEEITLHPADYPLRDLPLLPLARDPLADPPVSQSTCPVLRELEDCSTPCSGRARTQCSNCHGGDLPQQSWLLLHGLHSSPAVFDVLEVWLQQNFPGFFFYRPWFPVTFTADRMVDTLASRLAWFPQTTQWVGIGTSLGGLVGRSLLQSEQAPPGFNHLISILTPHQGTPLAEPQNQAAALDLFQQIREDLENADAWLGWMTSRFRDGADVLVSLENSLVEIMGDAAVPDLCPDSPFLVQLNSQAGDQSTLGIRGAVLPGHPMEDLYASLALELSPPYPLGSLDSLRLVLRDAFREQLEEMIAECWEWRFIDPLNDLHWDLVNLNQRWEQRALEVEDPVPVWEPLYSYYPGDACWFACPSEPFTCAPPPRENCCHLEIDPETEIHWYCCDCGEGTTVACYEGDYLSDYQYDRHDGVVPLDSQVYPAGLDTVTSRDLGHFAGTRSTEVFHAIGDRLREWGF